MRTLHFSLWVADIELAQWPAGHPDGMTAADFQD